jgi:hypothetical protein
MRSSRRGIHGTTPTAGCPSRGRAEPIEEGADEHIDRLAKKYLGQDRYPFRQEGEERVTMRVVPEHRNAMP